MENIVLTGLCCLCLLLAALLLWEHRQNILAKQKGQRKDRELSDSIAENLDLQQELCKLKEKYGQQRDMEREIREIHASSRTLKHDMKNHMLVLLAYLEAGKVQEAKAYTSQILDHLNKIYTYIHVGNSLLSYILNSKFGRAKELGLDIKAQIENLSFSYMDSMDFSALLNNLLDNAIEAAVRSQEKRMEVIVYSQRGFDGITVKNTIDSSVLKDNPELVTTKEEPEHGLGLMQIKRITEKYQGMLDIYEEELVFIINVVYPR